MPVQLLSAAYGTTLVGDVWITDLLVLDADGVLVHLEPADVVVALTDPVGTVTAPAATTPSSGIVRVSTVLALPGRHTMTVTAAGYGVAATSVVATAVVATLPTVADCDNYMTAGAGEHDWSTQDIADALAAETAAQASVCRTGPTYPPDLREALLRRVQRNLAMRPLALAMIRGDSESGDPNTFLPSRDPEIARLEKPYRKLPIG